MSDALAAALGELRALYQRLDAAVAAAAVRCDLRGLCCDFSRADHVLFATDLEVEYARANGGAEPPAAPAESCPYFQGGRCELRSGRPLGCRVYFCDPGYAETMSSLAERFHGEVKALHERHGVAYRYDRFIRRIREQTER